MTTLKTVPDQSYLRISKSNRRDTISVKYLIRELISDLKVKFER